MFDIQENLKKLPDSPGVYLHKDRLGNIIYVGKAISLRNRVRQYFQSSRNMAPKVRSMVSQIAEFEYITVASEMEALILECNLIKKYRPKYNVLLRDDKTYPYIKVTNEKYPRVLKTRIIKKDGGRYFGPYSDAGAVNRIVDLLNASFCLKRCSAVAFPVGYKPCLNYHIGQCRGICTGLVDKEEYAKAVAGAVDFLNGRDKAVIHELEAKMKTAAEEMRYEDAAIYRDDILAAKALSETQRVVMHHSKEADIVLPAGDSFMAIFTVREGKLVGRETYRMDAEGSVDSSKRSMVSAFLKQHYSETPNIPKEIIVSHMPEDGEMIEEYLSGFAGHNVKITRPERGEKRALLQMASRDVVEMVKTIEERATAAQEREQALDQQIHDVLCRMGAESEDQPARKYRVEAYDISNTNGVDTVGAMVVFDGLKADKQGYRKFKVRSIEGQDDYGSMREVLSRRFTRVFKGDDKFAVLPDIILMDGGKGHVSAALEVVDVTGFDIPVIGMVKDDHHRTRALVFRKPKQTGGEEEFVEIPLSEKPLLYKYIGQVQEEVHRFAITYHHSLRSKTATKSVLDEIPGIGPKRRRALLEAFESVENIRKIASGEGDKDPVEAFAEVSGMDRRAAESLCEFFRSQAK